MKIFLSILITITFYIFLLYFSVNNKILEKYESKYKISNNHWNIPNQ